jgi:hypothetical protein
MNVHEHFIVVLMEELAEMQQAAAKILRFSAKHQFESYDGTNQENLESELVDVLAALNILQALIGLKINLSKEALDKAIERKFNMFKKSIELGTIFDPKEDLKKLLESLKGATTD